TTLFPARTVPATRRAIPTISCISFSRKRPPAGAGVGAGIATRTPQRSLRRGGTRAWCDGILGTRCTSSRRTTPCRRANDGRALGCWPPCAPSRSPHGACDRTSRRTRRPRPTGWRSCALPRPTSKPSSCLRRTPTGCWRRLSPSGRAAPCMDRVERLAELGRERTACIVAFPDAYDVTLVLKNDARLDTIPELGKTPAVRALDVPRIESLVVQRILGAGTATPSLAY